jgi:hypothetical protein
MSNHNTAVWCMAPLAVVLLLLSLTARAADADQNASDADSASVNHQQSVSGAPLLARLLLPPAVQARLDLTEDQRARILRAEREFIRSVQTATNAPASSNSPAIARLPSDLRDTMRALQEARRDENRDAFAQGQERLRTLLQELAALREQFEPALFKVLDADQTRRYVALKSDLLRPGFLFGMLRPGANAENANPTRLVDPSSLVPLTEMGAAGDYQGVKGGLYPEGKNQRPPEHETAGRALAAKIQPLDQTGKPNPKGKIVLLAVGMSNTMQATAGFQAAADNDPEVNPQVVIVNGAQGGMTAARTRDPNDHASGTLYWKNVEGRLESAGVKAAQVQAVWVKQADASPSAGFPEYAKTLEEELAPIMQVLHERFPNLKLVYLSSRTFGGFAKTPLNPEPYAYESGFSVKWLIERQLKGDPALNFDPAKGPIKAPWLSWGPYLWANGATKRDDGFYYEETDFRDSDGTHESPAGQRKVGQELLKFFKADSTTRGWFLKAKRG